VYPSLSAPGNELAGSVETVRLKPVQFEPSRRFGAEFVGR